MKKFVWLFVVFLACIPIAYYFVKPKEKSLPVINPIDIKENTVDPELLRMGYGHTIGAFSFENQDGKWVKDTDFDDKVWVVEYFFTTCGSICPIMNEQMQRLHEHYLEDEEVQLLSFSVNPEFDTAEVLRAYADDHGWKSNQWQFLTGKKEEVYRVARKYFFLLKPAEVANAGDAGTDFIHTNNFVLIDKHRRIRGYYDGTDSKEVNDLLKDIDLLKEE